MKNPELTNDRFIADPFHEGQKLYRSGDTGRWRGDGILEITGRSDRQVKIRGFRIELTDVERNLEVFSGINDVTVICVSNGDTDCKLVAFFTSNETLSTLELRKHLKRRVPDYMIPSLFVQVDAFPALPSGKIDSKRLESLVVTGGSGSSGETHLKPTTKLEIEIAEIWRHATGLATQVGLNDNFFDVGGHSLSAVKVLSGLEDRYGVRPTFRDLMTQTLGTFAASFQEIVNAAGVNRHGQGAGSHTSGGDA